MGVSQLKTTVAVLRSIIGISDADFARLLDCSPTTIHSLESGRLKISESMAARIIHQTGVDADWLLDNDPKMAARAKNRQPYTREIFGAAQATSRRLKHATQKEIAGHSIDWMGTARAILTKANSSGRYFMALYKLRRALWEIGAEFGHDISVFPTPDATVSNKDRWQMLVGLLEAIHEDLPNQLRSKQSSGRPKLKARSSKK